MSGSSTNGGYSAYAFEFTAGETATITQVDVALVYRNIGTPSATVTLANDVAGLPSGSLGSDTLTNLPILSTVNPYETATGTLAGVTLTAGTTYWLEVTPGASDSSILWQTTANLPPVFVGTAKDSTGQGVYTSQGNNDPSAFDVLGNAVATPEPASLALGMGGLLLVAGVVRRRKA